METIELFLRSVYVLRDRSYEDLIREDAKIEITWLDVTTKPSFIEDMNINYFDNIKTVLTLKDYIKDIVSGVNGVKKYKMCHMSVQSGLGELLG